MPGPLHGITVLDFTRYQQGPFATVMLADLGASVIKVEPPRGGDYARRMFREPDGFSPFFEALDRGKRSVCIDVRTPAGRELALLLGERADIVTENFRPGTMEKWGLGYQAFRERNPGIIYAQATGWGTRGPLANYPSYDQIAQASSGFAQHAGGGPGHRPEIPYPGLADQTGGMNFAVGILAALVARERTGKGQMVDVSLLGIQLALQAPDLLYTLRYGGEREREFRASPTVGHYECSDGRWIMVAALDQKFWPRLCAALDIQHIERDQRFAHGSARWTHREELQMLLAEAFRRDTAGGWEARLRAYDVPCAVVRHYAEVCGDEQAVANGYIVEVDHPRFGRQRVVGPHVQLSETPARVAGIAPELGEHTVEILREAGVSSEQIEQLARDGVIAGAGL